MDMTRMINVSFQLWGSGFLLVMMVCLVVVGGNRLRSERLFLCLIGGNVGTMLMDALALYFRGRMGLGNRIGVVTSNFLHFFCAFLAAATFVLYLQSYIRERTGKSPSPIFTRITVYTVVVLVVLLVMNLVHPFLYVIDDRNIYGRLPLYPLLYLQVVVSFLVSTGLMAQYRKELTQTERVVLWAYTIVPVAATVLSALIYGIAFGHIGLTTAVIIMFVFIQSQQGKLLARKEQELAQSRIDTLISQIQPHFLYNILSSISVLCKKNPALASHATDCFMDYLRGNLDNLKRQTPVTLEEELGYVENYVWLEKLRFGGDLEVSYAVEEVDVALPAMSIQPLVENAIKHGMMGREGVCHILIEACEKENTVEITVSDDGVGFDLSQQSGDGRSHVGMENVQKRIEYMVGGSMYVESTPNKGTKVTIFVPKSGKSN